MGALVNGDSVTSSAIRARMNTITPSSYPATANFATPKETALTRSSHARTAVLEELVRQRQLHVDRLRQLLGNGQLDEISTPTTGITSNNAQVGTTRPGAIHTPLGHR
jgi:hypothetical protein